MSTTTFRPQQLHPLGRLIYHIFKRLRLIHVTKPADNAASAQQEPFLECNNFTLINFVLKICGPMHEQRLTILLLLFQVVCSALAFLIRYPGAKLFYDV